MGFSAMSIVLLLSAIHSVTHSLILRPGAVKIYDSNDVKLRRGWPFVREKFKTKMQSPVDINTEYATFVRLPPLTFVQYWDNEEEVVILENTGYTVKLKLLDEVPISQRPMITGGPCTGLFVFAEMHFHWGQTDDDGSEHYMDGQAFSCEMHIVHYNAKYGSLKKAIKFYDGVVVTGFFGDAVDDTNTEISQFIEDIKQIHKCHQKVKAKVSNIFSFIKKSVENQHYYTYPGSLTTPEFEECVFWILFSKPFEISSNQLAEFRHLQASDGKTYIHKNDRELQDFNNRTCLFAVGTISIE